jgi:hypothetical protein
MSGEAVFASLGVVIGLLVAFSIGSGLLFYVVLRVWRSERMPKERVAAKPAQAAKDQRATPIATPRTKGTLKPV